MSVEISCMACGQKIITCGVVVLNPDGTAHGCNLLTGAKETVSHPAHYGGAGNPYEAILVIEAWGLDFCIGNAVKYLSRAGKKDPTKTVEDLQKAVWYINRRIEQLQKGKP